MASGLSTPLGFTGIFFIIVGILMAVGGIIGLIVESNQSKSWWVWALLIGGVVLGIIGGILLAIALSSSPVIVNTKAVEMTTMYPNPSQIVVAPQPTPQYQQIVATPAPQYQQMVAPAPQYQQIVATPTPTQVVNPQVIYRQAPVSNGLPTSNLGTNTYTVGRDQFDPDPQTVVTTTPSTPRRVVATGPYGPGGQQIQVTGTYTPASTVTATTYDIANHPVVAGQNYRTNNQTGRQIVLTS